MRNARRYFRYDVVLPMHLELVDRYGKLVSAGRRQLISEKEEAKLLQLNAEVTGWLNKLYKSSVSSFNVFYMLNHRVDFMWWLIEHLMESSDPRKANEYRLKLKADAKHQKPNTQGSTKIGPLIGGFYQQIDGYIVELLEVVDSSIDGKIFKYTAAAVEPFDDKKYVSNLAKLAMDGILPAKVLQLLMDKMNLQSTVYERLKQAYKGISEPENWMNYQVNLSAGGFSFLSAEPYERFSSMDVFMEIDDEVVICRGKMVSQSASNDALFPYRIGVEFDLLSSEQEQSITLFEQSKELEDAMAVVSL